MKKILLWIATLCSVVTAASGIEVVNNEKTKLDINSSFQLMGSVQGLNDPYQDDVRSYMFLKQARVFLPGQYEDVKFRVELAFGGEEEVKNLNASTSLLDMYADLPLIFGTRFRVGQMLVPFGRERLVYERDLQFTARTINNSAVTLGRDAGGILYGNAGIFTGALGLFAGGGRDVPERYIPEKLGTPMLVAKIGINTGADTDILTVGQGAIAVEKMVFGVYLSGMFQRDSMVGHSTVNQVKMTEKSLMINSNWNPFFGQKPTGIGDLQQYALDFVMRFPVAGWTLSSELEANFAYFSNQYGTMSVPGGRAQLGAYLKPFEVALRYSAIGLTYSGFGYYSSTTGKIHPIIPNGMNVMQELALALTYYLRTNLKGMAEFSLSDVPVVHEESVGSYSLAQQPDQVTLLSLTKHTVERQTVKEMRLMVQYVF